jgi:hypothetical protein
MGGNVIWPHLNEIEHFTAGEANGRFSSLRASYQTGEISTEQENNETSSPGLSSQPGYAQSGQGIRSRPNLVNGYVCLDYAASSQ